MIFFSRLNNPMPHILEKSSLFRSGGELKPRFRRNLYRVERHIFPQCWCVVIFQNDTELERMAYYCPSIGNKLPLPFIFEMKSPSKDSEKLQMAVLCGQTSDSSMRALAKAVRSRGETVKSSARATVTLSPHVQWSGDGWVHHGTDERSDSRYCVDN